jgi:hypothetical protein
MLPAQAVKPRGYRGDLRPIPSPYRPNRAAHERITRWTPAFSMLPLDTHGQPVPGIEADLRRTALLAAASLEESTRRLYGYGILVYNVYADRAGLDDIQRFPPSTSILAAFIASVAGSYAGGTISSFLSALRAWHQVHLMPWQGHDPQLNRLVTGAARVAPESSTRDKTTPILTSTLDTILATLDWRADPVDAAVCAFCTTAFYGMARTGELVPDYLTKYTAEPRRWPKRSDIDERQNRFGDAATALFLPHTKSAGSTGEDIFWSAQPSKGDACPDAVLANHFRVNGTPDDAHVFAYRHAGGHRPLTRDVIRQRLARVRIDGKPMTRFHAFRIGGTLEFLLRRVPFAVVKVKGCWASNAFEVYLRKHAEIIAPYMADEQRLYDTFHRRYAVEVPRVR